jgi:hypothetical protein
MTTNDSQAGSVASDKKKAARKSKVAKDDTVTPSKNSSGGGSHRVVFPTQMPTQKQIDDFYKIANPQIRYYQYVPQPIIKCFFDELHKMHPSFKAEDVAWDEMFPLFPSELYRENSEMWSLAHMDKSCRLKKHQIVDIMAASLLGYPSHWLQYNLNNQHKMVKYIEDYCFPAEARARYADDVIQRYKKSDRSVFITNTLEVWWSYREHHNSEKAAKLRQMYEAMRKVLSRYLAPLKDKAEKERDSESM